MMHPHLELPSTATGASSTGAVSSRTTTFGALVASATLMAATTSASSATLADGVSGASPPSRLRQSGSRNGSATYGSGAAVCPVGEGGKNSGMMVMSARQRERQELGLELRAPGRTAVDVDLAEHGENDLLELRTQSRISKMSLGLDTRRLTLAPSGDARKVRVTSSATRVAASSGYP